MDIEGVIIMDLPLQEGVSRTGNNWKKKEWVLETFSSFPRKIKFTVFGERRIAEMPLELGKSYRINVELESREFNGRWYTDVNAMSATPIESGMMGGSMPAQSAQQSAAMPPFGQPMASAAAPQDQGLDPLIGSSNETDDLPF